MKTFFILYWLTFFMGWWAVRSYQHHLRFSERHVYAERHRRRLAQSHRSGRMNAMVAHVKTTSMPQLHLFE